MNRHRLLLNATLLGSALFAAGPPAAHATLIMTLQSGTASVTVHDNGSGDSMPNNGVISYSGALGNFPINVSTGMSKPALGSATVSQMDLNSVDLANNGGGTLTITLADTGFVGNGQTNFIGRIGGTTQGTVSFQYYLDLDNDGLLSTGTDQLISNFGPFTGGAFSGTQGFSYAFGSNQPYAMIMVANITQSTGQITSFNGAVQDPDPGTLALFSTGLVVLAGRTRRRRPKG